MAKYSIITDLERKDMHAQMPANSRDSGRDLPGKKLAYVLEQGVLVRTWDLSAQEKANYRQNNQVGRGAKKTVQVKNPVSIVYCDSAECPGFIDGRVNEEGVASRIRQLERELSKYGAYVEGAQLIVSP